MSYTYTKMLFALAFISLSVSGHPKEVEEWTKLIMRSEHGADQFRQDPSFLKKVPLSEYTKAEIKNQLKKSIIAQNKKLQTNLNNLNLEQLVLVYHITNKRLSVKDTPTLHALFNSLPAQLQKELAYNK